MNLRVPLIPIGAWTFSMLLHASGLCVALLLAAEFSVVPRVSSFRWDVTLVQASRTEPLISDTPPLALASAARMEPVTDALSLPSTKPAMHRMTASFRPVIKLPATDGYMPRNPNLHSPIEATMPVEDATRVPGAPTETSPQEPSPENPTPTSLVWPVTSSTPTKMPPADIEASDRSDMAMEPSVPEVPRLVSRPAPQFRPTPVSRHAQADYGWLANGIATEVEQIKRYPAQAKWHRWQGNVVVQAVIHEDGRISDIQVVASSGHDTLDHDAIALLERISPMQLQYPLDQSSIVVRIPIGYRLE